MCFNSSTEKSSRRWLLRIIIEIAVLCKSNSLETQQSVHLDVFLTYEAIPRQRDACSVEVELCSPEEK
jgi:hypothetical protein